MSHFPRREARRLRGLDAGAAPPCARDSGILYTGGARAGNPHAAGLQTARGATPVGHLDVHAEGLGARAELVVGARARPARRGRFRPSTRDAPNRNTNAPAEPARASRGPHPEAHREDEPSVASATGLPRRVLRSRRGQGLGDGQPSFSAPQCANANWCVCVYSSTSRPRVSAWTSAFRK